MLIDTSLVKVNDLVDKFIIPLQSKLILLSINCSACLLLQFVIIRYVQTSLSPLRVQSTFKARILPFFSLISLGILGALIGYLIFQQFYNEYYDTSISISIVVVSYGTSATFMIWLSSLF